MHSTFTGNSRRARNVNLSGQQNRNPFASAWGSTGNSQTVSHAQAERLKRQQERDRLNACRKIQNTWRSYKVRKTLRESRRHGFDEAYGPDGPSDPHGRVETALPLLLAFFRPEHAGDRERLSRVADDLRPTEIERLVSSCDQRNGYRLSRLAKVLVDVLDQEAVDQRYLALLARIASLTPQSLAPVLDRYYFILARLSITPPQDQAVLEAIRQAIASPLQASEMESALEAPTTQPKLDKFVRKSYRSFASMFLSTPNLPFWSDDFLPRILDMDHLAAAIIDLYKEPKPQGTTTEMQLWLLGHFVHLHQTTQRRPSGQNLYLRALQLQLEELAGDIRLRISFETGGLAPSDTQDIKTSEDGIQPLPAPVASMIRSLVDRDGISSLLAELTRTSEDSDGASLLAGYIIVLLRCFPSRGDDIRMRLFLGDVPTGSNGTVPVIKFLWHSVHRTKVYSQIVGDTASATTSLVREYLSGPRSTDSDENEKVESRDWRIILLFLELYTFILRLSDDDDFFSCIRPSLLSDTAQLSRIRSCGLSLGEVKSLTTFLKTLSFTLLYDGPGILENLRPTEGTSNVKLDSYFGQVSAARDIGEKSEPGSSARPDLGRLRGITTTVLRMLYERDSRRPFLPANHWLMTSRFDMGRFVDAVVMEQQRQQNELDTKDSDDDDNDEEDLDGDVIMGGMHSNTMTGYRLTRHAQIERLRVKQRKAQRDRMLSVIGPKLEVLKHMPFVIPFSTRVEIFRKFIDSDKMKRRDGLDADTWRMSMLHNPLMPSSHRYARHKATVTRGREFDDAYDQFFDLGEGLKEPIQIQFVDKFGEVEAGIDGGGVTKEFLISAIDDAFSSTSEDYFVANQQGLIYPNPVVFDRLKDLMRHSEPAELYDQMQDLLRRYEFLGRIVGKCMYEGILVDISFAGFFLLKWASGQTGENSYRGNLNDLRDLDEELYQGMLKLKNYNGNVADMGLDFTIEDEISGPGEPLKTINRNLVPNGENVPVTNDNRLLYISYVARHRLVAQPAQQTAAFLRGLRAMIAPSWLSMFNQNELQRLVGGDSSEIDIEDLRRNTIYSGLYDPGYSTEDHPTVDLFWKVVRDFTDEQRRLLLKYVTSTPRAPLLGFSQLNPRFSIRDGGTDEERLPSTSTCVNLLKLPRYTDEVTLRRKLLQAIESGAGFDLS